MYKKLVKSLEEFGYFIMLKQMAKVLNVISKECFNIEPNFKFCEFNSLVRNFNQNMIVNS